MFLCDVKNSANELNEKEFMKEISENIEGMKEVVECLEYEPENSNEWRMSQAAKVLINYSLNNLINSPLIGIYQTS